MADQRTLQTRLTHSVDVDHAQIVRFKLFSYKVTHAPPKPVVL
jgi:hypothetical protein